MITKRLLIPLLFFTALLFSACTFEFSTVIEADGSGELVFEWSASESDFRAIADVSDQDYRDLIDESEMNCKSAEDAPDLPEGTVVEYRELGNTFSCKIIIPFEDIDELIAQYQDMEFIEIGIVEMNSDGELDYKLTVDLTDADDSEFEALDEFEFLWNLTVPGSPTDHNADRERGRTLIWDLEPGEFIDIEVQSVPAGSNWLLIAGIVLVCFVGLIVVGVAVGMLLRQNK